MSEKLIRALDTPKVLWYGLGMTREEIRTVLYLAAGCAEDDQEPESHIGQYIWPGGAMNSNVAHYPEAIEITPWLASVATFLITQTELWAEIARQQKDKV